MGAHGTKNSPLKLSHYDLSGMLFFEVGCFTTAWWLICQWDWLGDRGAERGPEKVKIGNVIWLKPVFDVSLLRPFTNSPYYYLKQREKKTLHIVWRKVLSGPSLRENVDRLCLPQFHPSTFSDFNWHTQVYKEQNLRYEWACLRWLMASS